MAKNSGTFVSSSFLSLRVAMILTILSFSIMATSQSFERCWAQETDIRVEAKSLFAEALKLKKAGKTEDAAKTFENAVRKDRSILGEDDNGLITLLREMYAKRVSASPEDGEALEGMGFVASVCDADYAKAIEHYSKAVSLTSDDQTKTRLTGLIDGFKAQLAATGGSSSATSSSTGTTGNSPNPPDEVQMPASGTGNPGANDPAEATARREAKVNDLTRSKEEKENRLPQLEAEIKTVEEEIERNHRMYLSSNDRRYKRKEDAGEQEVATKKRQIEKLRKEIDRLGDNLDHLSKGEPEKAAPEGDDPPEDSPKDEDPPKDE